MLMSELKVEVDPAEAGFAADRLHRLDDNFARYVDDGLLAGWLLTISRHGKLAYVSHYGHRDKEAGLEVTPDTLWRIYSMSKPGHGPGHGASPDLAPAHAYLWPHLRVPQEPSGGCDVPGGRLRLRSQTQR